MATPKTAPAASPDSAPEWTRPAYQSRSRDQRDRLLKAGERVFAERGFWQAHVAEIARRADCSVGGFYRRFRDKEAFFFALQSDMAAHAERNIAAFFEDPACGTDPIEVVLRRLVASSARSMRGIQGYFRALFELSLRGHDVWPSMQRIEAFEADRLLELLKRRGVALEPEAPERALFAMRMMHGQIVQQLLHGPGPYKTDDPRFHEELARMLVRYLGLGAVTP